MEPGDKLVLKCIPARITNRGNPYEFDYMFYMENHGIKYYSFIDKNDISAISTPLHRKTRHFSLIIRNRIINLYRKSGVPEHSIPLVSAITLGEKSMLDAEAKQEFVKAGIMHIMAVSGLHAVILSIFIFNLMFFMKGKLEIPRVFLTLLFLWGFAFITGLTPSVLRATIMYSFLQGGKLIHRKPNNINSLLASAFILIIIKPSVIFDAGFLLSYSAVFFILAFYSKLYTKLEFSSRIADLIWQSAAVTIIAQLGTLPLTILMFNRFPVYFILTNIIIVPLSSLVIIAGLIVPVLYPLSFLNPIPGLVLGYLTDLTEYLTGRAASLPASTIENIGMTLPECIILFVLILILTDFLLGRKKSILFPLLIILVFLSAMLSRESWTLNKNQRSQTDF
jgi:competence protein ComEC